ncbi:MAG TPA: PLP-dependent aminotransferase family protein [Leptospiraceae bacterium]|nr:PLP-dependent aminotransferase family protein [Leptospirales bacterium]HMU84084.1 PLP-dependent aminotransferase family protein [Leptospiraceae bacterium]HMW60231.1 PLP-dependent aminotransferase family protein [Leptospiraceae bacterium]HMX56177.1 PLP-dependent aminotransferase family protein [Leptospiraceae bacterium]HMZ35038.1 PLP-dependent aminotransferase family protein [Leptospiraceae bacterium]
MKRSKIDNIYWTSFQEVSSYRPMIPLGPYLARHPRKQDALYHGLRDVILGGSVEPDSRLPSTRTMARQLGLSRGTVVLAYEMLESDGLIRLDAGRAPVVLHRAQERITVKAAPYKASLWASRLPVEEKSRKENETRTSKRIVDFNPGYTDPELFPAREWNQALHRAIRTFDPQVAEAAGGLVTLRRGVASYLSKRRGMVVHADQIVIVNGSIQAIVILSHILLGENSKAVLENPGYRGIRDAVRLCGASPIFAAVDKEGIRVRDWDAQLCFVTPARQFPTGAALSYDRRLELVEWAERKNAFILEDDYDSEFRRRGRPLEPLQCLAPARVVHVGTFSRTLAAGLRLGYAVLPENLLDPFLRAKRTFETHPAGTIEQSALSELMRSGAYERHLRRAARVYSRRHDLLNRLLRDHFGDVLEIAESETGLHVFAKWKKGIALFNRFEQSCLDHGIVPGSARRNYFTRYSPSLIFSVAHLSESQLTRALGQMAKILSAINY